MQFKKTLFLTFAMFCFLHFSLAFAADSNGTDNVTSPDVNQTQDNLTMNNQAISDTNFTEINLTTNETISPNVTITPTLTPTPTVTPPPDKGAFPIVANASAYNLLQDAEKSFDDAKNHMITIPGDLDLTDAFDLIEEAGIKLTRAKTQYEKGLDFQSQVLSVQYFELSQDYSQSVIEVSKESKSMVNKIYLDYQKAIKQADEIKKQIDSAYSLVDNVELLLDNAKQIIDQAILEGIKTENSESYLADAGALLSSGIATLSFAEIYYNDSDYSRAENEVKFATTHLLNAKGNIGVATRLINATETQDESLKNFVAREINRTGKIIKDQEKINQAINDLMNILPKMGINTTVYTFDWEASVNSWNNAFFALSRAKSRYDQGLIDTARDFVIESSDKAETSISHSTIVLENMHVAIKKKLGAKLKIAQDNFDAYETHFNKVNITLPEKTSFLLERESYQASRFILETEKYLEGVTPDTLDAIILKNIYNHTLSASTISIKSLKMIKNLEFFEEKAFMVNNSLNTILMKVNQTLINTKINETEKSLIKYELEYIDLVRQFKSFQLMYNDAEYESAFNIGTKTESKAKVLDKTLLEIKNATDTLKRSILLYKDLEESAKKMFSGVSSDTLMNVLGNIDKARKEIRDEQYSGSIKSSQQTIENLKTLNTKAEENRDTRFRIFILMLFTAILFIVTGIYEQSVSVMVKNVDENAIVEKDLMSEFEIEKW